MLNWLLNSLEVPLLPVLPAALLLSAPVQRALQTQGDDRIYIVHHAEIGKYEAFHTVRPSCQGGPKQRPQREPPPVVLRRRWRHAGRGWM